MSAALPTDSAADSAVQDFGLGPYDSEGEGEHSHGEDANEKVTKQTLPDGGGPDVQCPDRLLSYPDEHFAFANFLAQQDIVRLHDPAYQEWFRQKLADIVENPHRAINWFPFGPSSSLLKFRAEMKNTIASRIVARLFARSFLAAAALPGDKEAPTSHEQQVSDESTINDRTNSAQPIVSQTSELPDDHDNPSARSDYYDPTVVGQGTADVWADEDTGAYAGEETADSELPGVNKNETTMDDFLGALGNAWSGYEIEDLSGAQGFPTTDHAENVDFPKSNDDSSGGSLVASEKDRTMSTPKLHEILTSFDRSEISLGQLIDTLRGRSAVAGGKSVGEMVDALTKPAVRTATNLVLAGELAEAVLKEFGKKGLTKRHVLAYLQKNGHPQFLSSDIIRCLKHRHEVYVKDVLDEFPVAKQASGSIASIRDRVIALEAEYIRSPEVSSILRRTAAAITHAIVAMERLEDRNG